MQPFTYVNIKCHDKSLFFITKFNKVIILQNILNGVICIQQPQTLTPAHHKAGVLYSPDAPVVWFVLDVTFKGLISEPLYGVFGIPAGHRQPLISDMDGKSGHCASVSGSLLHWSRLVALQGNLQTPKVHPPVGSAAGEPRPPCQALLCELTYAYILTNNLIIHMKAGTFWCKCCHLVLAIISAASLHRSQSVTAFLQLATSYKPKIKCVLKCLIVSS